MAPRTIFMFEKKKKRKKKIFSNRNYKYFHYYHFLANRKYRFVRLNTHKFPRITTKTTLHPFAPIYTIAGYTKVLVRYKLKTSSVFLIKSIKRMYLSLYFSYWNLYRKQLLYIRRKLKYMPKTGNFFKIHDLSKKRRIYSIWANHVSSFSLNYHRKRFQFILGKHFMFQKKFTTFLLTLYNIKSLSFLYWHELRLVTLLLKSSFFYLKQDIFYFFQKKLLLINFGYVYSLHCSLHIHDILSIKYNMFTFHFFRKLFKNLNPLYFNYMRFYYKIQIKLFKKYPKTRTYRTNNKIFKKLHFTTLPVIYMEVDWLTLSIIVLNMFYFCKFYIFNLSTTNIASSSIRAYNWKYLS